MRYGNCFVGALALLWVQRTNKPRLMLRFRPNTSVPHFMVRTRDGLHHYRSVEEILPWPLCYVVFRGEFQTVQFDQEESFNKRGITP
jgi:hypothetical protein